MQKDVAFLVVSGERLPTVGFCACEAVVLVLNLYCKNRCCVKVGRKPVELMK